MVRAEAFPWVNFADATPGQLAWVYFNQLIDLDERKSRTCSECLPKWDNPGCEVCGKPLTDLSKLPDEIRQEVYRPGDDLTEYVKEREEEREEIVRKLEKGVEIEVG